MVGSLGLFALKTHCKIAGQLNLVLPNTASYFYVILLFAHSLNYYSGMILHKDGLSMMEYDVTADLLVVRWMDSKRSTEPELNYTIGILLEKIRSYDVKKLLIDAREEVEGITDEEYMQMNTNFAKLLAGTRLLKVARLGATNAIREKFVQALAEDLLALPDTKLQYHNFEDEQTAVQWLLKG